MRSKATILISGATGLLGRHLSDHFARMGWSVRGLVRNLSVYPFLEKDIQVFHGNLPEEIDFEAFKGVDVFIHCAYMTKFTNNTESERVNYLGTQKVYAYCKKAGVRKFVFISSCSAHDGALSYYGKSKYQLEKEMDHSKDLIIRPGLILSSDQTGLFHRIKKTIESNKFIPLLDGGRQIIQTVYIEDLCSAITLAIEKNLTGVFVVAEEQGLAIGQLWKMVARKLEKKCIFVPTPSLPILLALRVIEILHIPFPISSENLLGLKGLKHVPSQNDLEKIGINVKPTEETLDIIFQESSLRSSCGNGEFSEGLRRL